MKTDKITVFDLFDRQRRYLVPIFQRGYVWTKDGQWEPLWDDIADQAELIQSHKGSFHNAVRKHFLGAIVLSQVPTVIKQTPASEIIDGQQRLLTLQIFLAALRDAVIDLGDEYLNMQLGRLTANPGPFNHEDEQFKVWPTNAYHDDLKSVMTAGTPGALAGRYPQRKYYRKMVPPRPALVEAYLYFHERIKSFLTGMYDEADEILSSPPVPAEAAKERANLLFEALMRYVQLVEIQLDAEDDPQVIFETLNYRGVPLEPSDLIRNFIFLYAARQDKDVTALYDRWWKDYDEAASESGKFWKEKERQGRFFRSRLDLFFFHYLTCRVGREIKMGHIYQEFKDWWGDSSERSLENELEAAQRSSLIFRSLLEPDYSHRLGLLAQRLRILDTTTVYPFMIWLCENRQKITADEFNGILADIESYIVRRAVCRLTPKNYNRIFVTLLTKLRQSAPSRTAIQRELLDLEGDSALWPDDEFFKRILIYEPLYDLIGPRRVRLVLTGLELAGRTPRQEALPLPVNNSLTVEHIMPQSFRPEEWPYPNRDSADQQGLGSDQGELEHRRKELELTRLALLHSIGNLTLLTQPLNSEVSNGPFRLKRPEITKQSLLTLNSYFQSYSDDDSWHEDTILERGRHLADLALKVWKYPEV